MMNLTMTYDHRLVDGAYGAPVPQGAARGARGVGRRVAAELFSLRVPPAVGLRGSGGYLMSLGGSVRGGLGSPARARGSRRARRGAGDGDLRSSTPRRSRRPAHRATARCTSPTAPTSRSSRRTAAGLDLPRPRPARLLPDPRLKRHGKDVKRSAATWRRRSSEPSRRSGSRPSGSTGSRASGSRRRAAQARVDRCPPLALDLDARVRAQCRPRPGSVHRAGSRPAGSKTRRSRRWPASSGAR